MKILAVGDIVGKTGLQKLKETLPQIVKENNIDFIIVNGENAAEGMGITEKMYQELLSLNVDKQIIRPANYPNNNPGKGYDIYECNGKSICVMNLIGRTTMPVLTENPFLIAKDIILEIKEAVDIIIVDFHAEATAEKIAMGYYLDGDATIVYGTHTHVQTADETILEQGTGYITDIGMTGPKKSVIGMDVQASLKRFETSLPERYKIAEGKAKFNSCLFEIDDNTNKVKRIERINK